MSDQSGIPGYEAVCALADALVSADVPLSLMEIERLTILASHLNAADKKLQFKTPASSLLTTKSRSSRKSTVTPGLDSTKK